MRRYLTAAVVLCTLLSVTAAASATTANGKRMTAIGATKPAVSDGHAHDHESVPANDRAHGLVFDGLHPGRAGGPCAGAFELPAVAADACSHGPDPVPEGLDVSVDADALDPAVVAATPGIVCDGDGVSGNRTAVIYAVTSDRTDRYSQYAASIATWAAGVESIVAQSAASHGGERHVRWETSSTCDLTVTRVVLPATADDNISNTITALQAAGFNRTDRKYLVFMDANVYCGIAQLYGDDRATADNLNNGGRAMFARVDAGCWNGPTAAHELFHNLGAVQSTAPNASALGHCTDEWDLMCYSDAAGVIMTYPCGSAWSNLLDCGGDDYFRISPPSGSYLASHWNTANSRFLMGPAAPPPPSTTTTTTTVVVPTSTTTTTTAPPPPPPSTTTTQPPATSWSFGGNLTRQAASATFSISPASSGTLTVRLTEGAAAPQNNGNGGGRTTTWRTEVRNAAGAVVATGSGPSGLTVTAPVSAGTYTIVVSAGRGTFTAAATLAIGG